MRRKLTITLDEKVYIALHQVVGRGAISRLIEELVRPHVMDQDLDAAYRELAQDKERELEALEWAEAMIGDASVEPR